MNASAIIIAKKRSKGIPSKNIVNFCGKPLISWTILQLLECFKRERICISSDSKKILKIAEEFGIGTIERPTYLAMDNTSSEKVWIHAIKNIEKKQKLDLIVAPQVTSPIRGKNDFKKALELFKKKDADSLLSVTEIKDFFIWEKKKNFIEPVNYNYENRKIRQVIEKKYLENGSFYIFKKNLLLKKNCRLGGKIIFYKMKKHQMFQIDEKEDLKLCAAIMEKYL